MVSINQVGVTASGKEAYSMLGNTSLRDRDRRNSLKRSKARGVERLKRARTEIILGI